MRIQDISKKFAIAACALTVFGLGASIAVPSYAAHAGNAALNAEIKAAPKYSGKVISIDTTKGTITIQEKKLPPMTFNVATTTRIRVDHAKSTLADIIVGKHATVRSDDKVTALAINQITKPKSVATDDAGDASPAPGAAPFATAAQ